VVKCLRCGFEFGPLSGQHICLKCYYKLRYEAKETRLGKLVAKIQGLVKELDEVKEEEEEERKEKLAIKCDECGNIRVIELPYRIEGSDVSSILYCQKCGKWIQPIIVRKVKMAREGD
jgi:DNA-directed RNA polymerase subunit M/transcription elongation factor TFIIS